MKNKLFIWCQYLMPQHFISRILGLLADNEWAWLKNRLIGQFVRRYQVDLTESKIESVAEFINFNAFFTRELKPGARVIADTPFVSPADGVLSQYGTIENGHLIQAKGRQFSVRQLLGCDQATAERMEGGRYATVYLSPSDYHRVHMPCDGRLTSMTFIPGKLFSVNQITAENVPALFARNERVVANFDTEHGHVAMVLVGAVVVASIETVWAGEVAPLRQGIMHKSYGDTQKLAFARGEEMGRFKLGSTVVLLAENPDFSWSTDLSEGMKIRMGEALAN